MFYTILPAHIIAKQSQYVLPYLDHFGIPYLGWDINRTPLPANLGAYALVVIAHPQVDPGGNQLPQQRLLDAVTAGSGLVTFDPVLDMLHQLEQKEAVDTASNVSSLLQQTSKSPGSVPAPGAGVMFTRSHPITSRHASGETIPLAAPFYLLPITGEYILLTSDSAPLLTVSTLGMGRIVQWASTGWMDTHSLGPLGGLDDVLWRSLVWATRKPFIMRGLPPLVTMRVDDVAATGHLWGQSPLWWVHTANQSGFKPWLGLFPYNLTEAAIAELRGLLINGKATAFPHAFGRPQRTPTPSSSPAGIQGFIPPSPDPFPQMGEGEITGNLGVFGSDATENTQISEFSPPARPNLWGEKGGRGDERGTPSDPGPTRREGSSKSQFGGERRSGDPCPYYDPASLPLRASSYDEFIYYDHEHARPWPAAEAARGLAALDAWYAAHGPLKISSYAIAHWGEMGSNTLAHIHDQWGCEFIATYHGVDAPLEEARWLVAGPFRQHETPGSALFDKADRGASAMYYADFINFADRQFFLCCTEVRDETGYEWAPDGDVEKSAARGLRQLRRALDSFALPVLFTHETDYIYKISPDAWQAQLAIIASGLSAYEPIYVTLDEGIRYVRATKTSRLVSAAYDPAIQEVTAHFSGRADVLTYYHLFTNEQEISSRLVEVPLFADGCVIKYKVS